MSKAELRAEVRAARRARPPADIAASADLLATHAMSLLTSRPARISAYLSMPKEPGTDPLIRRAHEAGHVVLVPRIDGRALHWVILAANSTLARGPMGIREPVADPEAASVLDSLDVMFVPGLAVDPTGRRLGQGGGYYDRTLSRVPAHADGGPMIVAVLYDDELRDDVPVEPHDCRVDAAITPGGITRFR